MDEMTETELALKAELLWADREDIFVYSTARRWFRNVESLLDNGTCNILRYHHDCYYFHDSGAPVTFVVCRPGTLSKAGFDLTNNLSRATLLHRLSEREILSAGVMN